MIRAATEADAEAIYELLFAARDEIPLRAIETDPRDGWLEHLIRPWCSFDHSLIAELHGEADGAMIVIPRRHGWELRYVTILREHRGKLWFEGEHLIDALFARAVEPFEIIHAEVLPDNKSKMVDRLPLWGFEEEKPFPNGTVRFKLTREAAGGVESQ